MKESIRAISPTMERQGDDDDDDDDSPTSTHSSPSSPLPKRKRPSSPERFKAATELTFDDCSDSGEEV